jgi:hypothetical protein
LLGRPHDARHAEIAALTVRDAAFDRADRTDRQNERRRDRR